MERYVYRFYYLNISIMMLGITLSIHNNENCYVDVLKRSIFRQVYYYPAMLTVFNNNAFASHTIHAMKPFNHDAYERPNGPIPELRNRNSYIIGLEMHTVCLEIKTFGIDIYTWNVAIKHQETLHIILKRCEILDIRPRKVV